MSGEEFRASNEASSYEVEPAAPPTERLPLVSMLPGSTPAAREIDLAREDAPCLNCGYNLRGLTREGKCPECGTPVMRSLQGNLLQFSSEDYLAALHRGVTLILIAVLASLGIGLLALLVALAASMAAANGLAPMFSADAALTLLSFVVTAISLVGWWLFSSPDPAILGNERGDMPRQVVRASAIAVAATTAAQAGALLPFINPAYANAIAVAAAVVGFIVEIIQFFASMLYVRWLGPRIPDPQITARAKAYMWQLPLICVLGACVVIGPLIATIMYYLLLNKVRLHIRSIREKRLAELHGVLPAAM